MTLLEVYEDMQKAAQLDQNILEKTGEEAQLEQEKAELLYKYAEAAENMLAAKYGSNYEADDIIKLASFLIDWDVEAEEQQEKVAELIQSGQIIARSYVDELVRLQNQ